MHSLCLCIIWSSSRLTNRLAFSRAWHDLLSLGEMQRLSIIRIIHHRPQLAILDECTSALSPEIEDVCYRLLDKAGITLVSVAHRPSVALHHKKLLVLDGRGGWSLKDVKP